MKDRVAFVNRQQGAEMIFNKTRMEQLKQYDTSELVEAAANREGVDAEWVEPEEEKVFTVSGPARVLVVTD